jgi:hypothetical protein
MPVTSRNALSSSQKQFHWDANYRKQFHLTVSKHFHWDGNYKKQIHLANPKQFHWDAKYQNRTLRLNQAQSGLFPFQQTRARKKSILPPSLSTVATLQW